MTSIIPAALEGAAGCLGASSPQPDGSPELGALLEKLPANDYATARAVLDELLQGGEPTIRRLVGMVGEEFGDPRGVKAKYALHGLTHHVSRPNADAQRAMVARTLAGLLSSNHSEELKAFLCRQLQLCGRSSEVSALAGLLQSDRLIEPATQALTAIGDSAAREALRSALKNAAGKRRTSVVNALGALGDRGATAVIRRDIRSDDADLRLVAWYALGNAADGDAVSGLLEAASGPASYERTQATDACLRLARALAEAGKPSRAAGICHRLLDMRKGPADVHDRCAAMECLASVLQAEAVDEFLTALGTKERRLRYPLARIAVDLAREIHEVHPEKAEKLLRKVLEATEEEAVHAEAKWILSEHRSGQSASVCPRHVSKGGHHVA